jgi:hypothetical protein
MASNSHILVFPFMAQGHTIPLLDLAKLLSRRGFKVTILTTPSNASSISSYTSQFSNIHLKEISFPQVQGLPKGCENMSQLSRDHLIQFFKATKLLQQPFEKTLEDMSKVQDPPVCVFSDSFLGWTNESCRVFGIPRFVFHGMGVLPMAIKKSLLIHQTYKVESDEIPLVVKGVQLGFTLTKQDLPKSIRETDINISQFFLDAEKSDIGSWGVIANSFFELEKDHVSSLESMYGNETKVWCVGPLFLYDQIGPNPSTIWAQWLNQKVGENSVIYVSFGSLADLSEAQLDELAYGLELSGHDYFLIVRSKNWNPPCEINGDGRGLIVREWVDQRWILAHEAIGGFLSHCGWNSVLESLSVGVPILAWPMGAEQHLNAKYLVEELKVGVQVPNLKRDQVIVRREVICEGVKELMGGEKGLKARKKAVEFGRMAIRSVEVGGSSYNNLDKLVDQIRHMSPLEKTM